MSEREALINATKILDQLRKEKNSLVVDAVYAECVAALATDALDQRTIEAAANKVREFILGMLDGKLSGADVDTVREANLVGMLRCHGIAPGKPVMTPLQLLDRFQELTQQGPEGAEVPHRGCSVYNWRMAVLHDLRRLLADPDAKLEGQLIGDIGEPYAKMAQADKQSEPIPMLLFCPRCGTQHIDAPQPEKGWTNPPHRSHECQSCGAIWRPADVATTGVARIETRGKADTWSAGEAATPQADKREAYQPSGDIPKPRTAEETAKADALARQYLSQWVPDYVLDYIERLKAPAQPGEKS